MVKPNEPAAEPPATQPAEGLCNGDSHVLNNPLGCQCGAYRTVSPITWRTYDAPKV
jgi:hypothetical protein